MRRARALEGRGARFDMARCARLVFKIKGGADALVASTAIEYKASVRENKFTMKRGLGAFYYRREASA